MGSGKTTVGRALAKKLNKRFIDSDHEIEARTGASIALIFEVEGEASFRQREAEVICELTQLDDIVLGTGGGAVLNPDSRAFLAARGTVIYLRASVNSVLQRTSHDKTRPLLQTADPRRRIEELSRQRDPLYAEIADVVIDTGRPNVQFLVHSILAQLEMLPPKILDYSMQAEIMPGVTASITDVVTDLTADGRRRSAPIVLNVDLGERSYPILIGPGLIDDVDLLRMHVGSERVAIAVISPA